MAMTKADFQNALRAAVSAEFQHIPENEREIRHAFSAAFLKRMEKLFCRQKKIYWNFVNTGAKRVAVVFVAMAMLFATACSIPPVREGLAEFAVEVYETFLRLVSAEEKEPARIEREYTSGQIPAGFVETDRLRGKKQLCITYEDPADNMIVFKQTTIKDLESTLDREESSYRVETIGDKEVLVWERDGRSGYMWIQEQYQFEITVTGEVSAEAMREMIAGVA